MLLGRNERFRSAPRSSRNKKKLSSGISTATSLALLVLSVCVLFAFFIRGEVSALATSPSRYEKMVQPPPFSLFVTLTFTASEHKDKFLQDIAPVAAYIKVNERDTLAYEVLMSDQDPLQVLVMERYKDKENAFLKAHRSSGPFQAFRPKLKAMEQAGHVSISGHSYIDSQVGFGDRCN